MGAWTEIVDFTFTANETSRAFTGLNITKDDFIKVVFTHLRGSTTDSLIRLFANSSTNTDYTRQSLVGIGTTVSANRSNQNIYSFVQNTETSTNSITYLKLSQNDRFNFFGNRSLNSSNVSVTFDYNTSSGATFTSGISSLNFFATATNAIGSGSRVQIYRLDAEKVEDVTTTSNQTRIDFTGLNIGKDSEYLLIGDWIRNTVDQPLFLGVNNNVTFNNYNVQRITGNDSTAGASRAAEPRVSTALSSDRSVFYAHIKLSEIGAFTVQSYSINRLGTSNVTLENDFLSSTAENITSITALNLFLPEPNNIASGSRFILYKLK
jgi:hypothetical protein